MQQFDAKADLIEHAVECLLGILLYVAIVYQRYRYPLKSCMQKWYNHSSPILLSIFVIGSGSYLSYAIARSPDPPAPVLDLIWKAMMISCLTMSKLHYAYEIISFRRLHIYCVGIVISPAFWVGGCLAGKRYSATWAFPGCTSFICAVALFETAVSRCTATKTQYRCLALGLTMAVAALLSIVLAMVSLVPLRYHFTIQYSILFLIIAPMAGFKWYVSWVDEKESAKRRVDIVLGVYNPGNVARQTKKSQAEAHAPKPTSKCSELKGNNSE